MEERSAEDEIMRDAAKLDVSCCDGFTFGIDAALAGIAVVIEVVGAVGREEIRRSCAALRGIARCLVIAAVGIDHIVIDERMAITTCEIDMPVRSYIEVQPRVAVDGVEDIGLGPRLVAQHHRWIDRIERRDYGNWASVARASE